MLKQFKNNGKVQNNKKKQWHLCKQHNYNKLNLISQSATHVKRDKPWEGEWGAGVWV